LQEFKTFPNQPNWRAALARYGWDGCLRLQPFACLPRFGAPPSAEPAPQNRRQTVSLS
jgi:hypothetical protein